MLYYLIDKVISLIPICTTLAAQDLIFPAPTEMLLNTSEPGNTYQVRSLAECVYHKDEYLENCITQNPL